MKKRIFSILLALTMILTFMPAMAFAALGENESAVAKIGTEEYPSLGSAINAANDGDTITLVANTSENFTSNKTFSLNLGGKTLTVDANEGVKSTAGVLTITNGTITSDKDDIISAGGGQITLGEGLTVSGTSSLLYSYNGGTISINKANLTTTCQIYATGLADNSTINMIDGSISAPSGVLSVKGSDGKINISGGTIDNTTAGNKLTIYVYDGAALNMTGGYVKGSHSVVGTPDGGGTKTPGKIQISGGKIESTQALAAVYGIGNTAEISITGGEISGVDQAVQATKGCQVIISGGTLSASSQTAAVVGSGYNGNADGSKVTITGGTIQGKYLYASKGNIEMTGGTLEGNVYANGGAISIAGGTINGNITASGDGAVVDITGGTATGNYLFASGGKITVENGTINAPVYSQNSGNIDISGGTFTKALSKQENSTLVISGGTFSTDVSSYVNPGTSADKTVAAKDADGKYHVGAESEVAAAKVEHADNTVSYYTNEATARSEATSSGDKVVVKLKIEFQRGDTSAEGEMAPVYTYEGWSYTLPTCKFRAPAGKSFDGWSVNGAFAHAGDTITITRNTTVIAQWKTGSGGSGGKSFETIQTEALSEISAVYVSSYDKADQTAITNAINTAKTAISNAKTAAQIESALATFKSTIAQYKTTAQKLSDAKTSALAEINAVKPADYAGDATAKAAVEKAISTAKTAVNAATTVDAVNTAMTTFRTEMAKYKKDAQKALEKSKSDAIAELDAIKLTSYQEPEKTAVKNAIADAKTAIEAATTTTAVDTALAAAKETIAKQAKYKSSLPKPKAKAPAKAKKALTAKWTKLSAKNRKKVTGFQVQIATNKTFTKNAKIYTAKGKAKTSKKIKSLKAKKTYYVRVRTYKSTDGVKTVGKWSAVKKIKTK